MRESVHRLTQMDRILAHFHNRKWGLLFLALVLQAGELGVGLRLFAVQGRDLCS